VTTTAPVIEADDSVATSEMVQAAQAALLSSAAEEAAKVAAQMQKQKPKQKQKLRQK